MRYLFLIFALGLAGGTLLPAGSVLANQGDIEVITMDVESQFPDGVRFTITARSSEEIEDIRVFFNKGAGSNVSAYRSVDFQPGTMVTGESILNSGGGGSYFPPGTQIKFSFEIRRSGVRFSMAPPVSPQIIGSLQPEEWVCSRQHRGRAEVL